MELDGDGRWCLLCCKLLLCISIATAAIHKGKSPDEDSYCNWDHKIYNGVEVTASTFCPAPGGKYHMTKDEGDVSF